MSLKKFLVATTLSILTLGAAPPASAQTSAPAAKPSATVTTAAPAAVPDGGVPHYIRPETPEQRRERLSMPEDPGLDPDPNRIWLRFGKKYKIAKFEKKWAKYTDVPGMVKPMANVNFIEELYQENDRYVWVWLGEIEPADSEANEAIREAAKYRKLDQKQIEYLEAIRGEFTPLDVPASDVRVRFEKASEGLPEAGNWRNSLTVADMNEDGRMDVIVPPERAGRGVPYIFLGDGKGKWTRWTAVEWPSRLNYGSVVAADFNKDRHMDLAFGIHLSGVAILYGDGKGKFREVERDTKYPTRRIIAEDVNGDGWMDVVALSEGPVIREKTLKKQTSANLLAYVNTDRGAKWETLNISEPNSRISGDWLSSGDFNGDRRADYVGSTMYFNAMETMYLSKGKSEFERVGNVVDMLVPSLSYYWATTAGPFSARDRDDAIVSYTRRWVGRLDPNLVPPPPLHRVVGLDRISFKDGVARRTSIMRWGEEDARQVTALNHGDFDGDGNEDAIFTKLENREAYILLGDGRGGFRQSVAVGVDLPSQKHYDVTVADVNGDKLPDLLFMYEAQSGTAFAKKNGAVEVFLNRGVVRGE